MASTTPTSSDVAVSIRRLHKAFGKATALHSLDLEVHKGEFLVLLGPSGCGKTTTMRSIAGLETPTGGAIHIGGVPVFDRAARIDVDPSKRDVGMVFQSYAIWPHRTVRENIAFPLKMKKVPKRELRDKVDKVIELVGMTGFDDRSASMLSGGQMQRVALARSIVMEPEVLLLDEPLSNLDAKLREKLRVELLQTQRRLGTTSIYVTHDQSEALALADRIVLMRAGRIEQIAEPLELYQSPKTRFAAEFIGTNNMLKGKAVGDRVELADFALTTTWKVADGGPVSVCLRAEDLVVDPTSGIDVNRFPARVEFGSLLGSQVQYTVTAGGTTLEVVAPFGGAILPSGSEITLGIAADVVRAFDDDGTEL